MTRDLFVYGMLLPALIRHRDLPRSVAAVVRRAEDRGAATVRGTLYDAGSFPALRLEGNGLIHGGLLRMPDDPTVWAVLDHFECTHQRLYERKVIDVHRQGETVPAHIYVYLPPVENLQNVSGGSWLRYKSGS